MKSTDKEMKTYPVNEIFYSLQGEGFHTGTPSVFVRFSGCNRRCSFCDTDFSQSTPMTAAQIADVAATFASRHMVLTGGEPAMWVDDSLVVELKRRGFYLQMETNGSLCVNPGIDWITCSPKAEPWLIERIDELKIVYQGDDEAIERLGRRFSDVKCRFLQPCSGLNTSETIAYILSHPEWRLSLQTHKLLDIR